jgi:hypothetical protein
MAFNINDFLQSVPNELAREAHFELQVNFPSGVGGDEKLLSLMCGSVALPTRELEFSANRRYSQGLETYYATGMKFTPLSVSFYCDTNTTAITSMHKWMDTMMDLKTSGNLMSVAYKDDYKKDIKLTQFDTSGATINSYTFVEAFPFQIGQINFSWAARNNIIIVPVTFFYSYYTVNNNHAGNPIVNNQSTYNKPAQVTGIDSSNKTTIT